MTVDSFKFLPGSIAAYYRNLPVQREEPVPFTPLGKPLEQCRFALVTTAGIYHKGKEPPFDAEREKREPMWGDPSFRRIPGRSGRRGSAPAISTPTTATSFSM